MKIGLISLGCPKNLVDSEVMLGLAEQAGHRLTRDPAEADVLVINTCAFIDRAKQESVDAILEMAAYKRQGACRRLVVAGCLAERYRDELKAEIPEIDAIIGTGEVPRIVEALGGPASAPGESFVPLTRANGQPVALRSVAGARTDAHSHPPAKSVPSALPTYIYDADTPRLLATPRHYAYLKIAEGCDYKCAFCIIPTLRGRYRSRPAESIVQEARRLAAQGVKELLLISQDTSFYGVDRGERGALARLLRALNRVGGLEWIRMLYLYPTTIGDEVLDAVAESEHVCKYIDLPLQHAADGVLARMRRPGSRTSYERLLARIRERIPGVTLRTTFIVGFPGESDSDFEELDDFVRSVEFDHVGVFTYSHEEGTSAHGLPDDVPTALKRQRHAHVMRTQKRIVTRRHAATVGHQVRVLVDGPAAEHELVLRGRLERHAPEIDPLVYLTDCDPADFPAGTFLRGTIVGSRGYDLLVRPAVASSSQSDLSTRSGRLPADRPGVHCP
jgi:ribosomal protein S12 methylthiotransferase